MPLAVKPTRSTRSGNPPPSCLAGTYTSTARTEGSPSMLLFSASLSMVSRLTEPVGPKNLRMDAAPVVPDFARRQSYDWPTHFRAHRLCSTKPRKLLTDAPGVGAGACGA